MQRNNENKRKNRWLLPVVPGIIAVFLSFQRKESQYLREEQEENTERIETFYEKNIKRGMDILCSVLALVVFWWVYLVIAILVRMKLGSPVLFRQTRPGKDEKLFELYKFRTMTDERDENGNLLPDEARLTAFGKALRKTSLDELPEVFNILKGDMSIVGPRPQLVRDMVFMTDRQRRRHLVRPGLSGLAQVKGRNNIDWEEKLDWDLKYIGKITFRGDVKIILQTVIKAFIKQEGITEGDMATAEDLGDYLLKHRKIGHDEYIENQKKAKKIIDTPYIKKFDTERVEAVKDAAKAGKYSVLMSLYKNEKPEYLRLALNSILGQTIAPDEIILVEDGVLTEELYAVISEYKDDLHIVRNEKNMGLGLALNRGLQECRNELVARMDTDDISKWDRCEKQLKRFVEKPYLVIVGSHIDEFVGNPSNIVSSRKVPLTSEEIYHFAKRRSAFNHPAVMYSKTAVLENGGYADLKRNQDVDLFGRMLFNGYQAENIDESLLWFRSSNELAKRRKSWQNTWSYITTIYRFWRMGYSNFADYLLVTTAQIGMWLIPVKMQYLIYKKLLRK